MEKLELKHLAPYLPYGLQMMSMNDGMNDGMKYTLNIKKLSVFDMTESIQLQHNPILHNLSDLTKKIKHGNCTFIPESYLYFEVIATDNDMYGLFQEFKDDCLDGIDCDISHKPYCVIRQLFEWHFDVFGLIGKGLAIDINTL